MSALIRLPEVEAMADALEAAGLGANAVDRRRRAIRVLNRLHERHWELDRTAAGIRADTIAEFCVAAKRAAAEGDQEEADACADEVQRMGGPFPFNALGVS